MARSSRTPAVDEHDSRIAQTRREMQQLARDYWTEMIARRIREGCAPDTAVQEAVQLGMDLADSDWQHEQLLRRRRGARVRAVRAATAAARRVSPVITLLCNDHTLKIPQAVQRHLKKKSIEYRDRMTALERKSAEKNLEKSVRNFLKKHPVS